MEKPSDRKIIDRKSASKIISQKDVDKLFKDAGVKIITLGGVTYAIFPASNLKMFFSAGADAMTKVVKEVKL